MRRFMKWACGGFTTIMMSEVMRNRKMTREGRMKRIMMKKQK
jgi:hypothetical protein